MKTQVMNISRTGLWLTALLVTASTNLPVLYAQNGTDAQATTTTSITTTDSTVTNPSMNGKPGNQLVDTSTTMAGVNASSGASDPVSSVIDQSNGRRAKNSNVVTYGLIALVIAIALIGTAIVLRTYRRKNSP